MFRRRWTLVKTDHRTRTAAVEGRFWLRGSAVRARARVLRVWAAQAAAGTIPAISYTWDVRPNH